MEPSLPRQALDETRGVIVGKRLMHRDVVDTSPTVFVIDDDIAVQESLERLIRAAGWEAESFASAEEFFASPRRTIPCCLILDLTSAGSGALDVQKQLAGRLEMPIICVSAQTDVPMAVQAMKAGAVEFLTKPLRTDLLLDAIRDAFGRSRAALHLDAERRALRACYQLLTPRERDVMALVVSGLLNKQVGFELGITEPTVKAHRGQVMNKMRAGSLPELVSMAMRLGLQSRRDTGMATLRIEVES
jgi:FixJ family two-component response regulator